MPHHTCTNYPDTWDTCKACQSQAHYFSTNRDYELEIDGPHGYFAEGEELKRDHAENMRKMNPYYLRPRTRYD
jgi:hypothetical protein